MKIEFLRPTSLSEALETLVSPRSVPLAGGTSLNNPEYRSKWERQTGSVTITLVDLQNLGLNHLRKHGDQLDIEACVTLQQLCENVHTPQALKEAIKLEAPLNIRNMETAAGTLVSCTGRSAFSCAMLALDARLSIEPGTTDSFLGNYLPLRKESVPGKLITRNSIPLNATLAFEHVGRTKYDLPIVCAAVAKWASGRTRLALGGYGSSPLLAMDGTADDDIKTAARNGYHEAVDEWASADYRAVVAATLAGRSPANRRLVTVWLDAGDLKYRIQAPLPAPAAGWERGSTQVLASGLAGMRCRALDGAGAEVPDATGAALVECTLTGARGRVERMLVRLRTATPGLVP